MVRVARGCDIVDRGVRGRRTVSGVLEPGMWGSTGSPGSEVVVCCGEYRHVGLIGRVKSWLATLFLHHRIEHRARDHCRRVFHTQRGT